VIAGRRSVGAGTHRLSPPGFSWECRAPLGYVAAAAVLLLAVLGCRGRPASPRSRRNGGRRRARLRADLPGTELRRVLRLQGAGLLARCCWPRPPSGSRARCESVARSPPRGRGGDRRVWGLQLVGLRQEIVTTGIQVTGDLRLRGAAAQLPAGASIRLDIIPDSRILWAAYMLNDHPLSSQRPLTGTTYPYAPRGRGPTSSSPTAAWRFGPGRLAGSALFDNGEYRIYAMRRDVPGRDRSSEAVRGLEQQTRWSSGRGPSPQGSRCGVRRLWSTWPRSSCRSAACAAIKPLRSSFAGLRRGSRLVARSFGGLRRGSRRVPLVVWRESRARGKRGLGRGWRGRGGRRGAFLPPWVVKSANAAGPTRFPARRGAFYPHG